MSKRKSYQTTEQDLNELKNKKNVNERIEWIRKKASEVNEGLYTVSKVANDIKVSPSVITKLESGFTKNPNLDLLQSLSSYFCVPIIAFFDEYYESPYPFTIFGPRHSGLDVGPLFREAYEADFCCTVSSLNSQHTDTIEGRFYLTPLEIEEFQEELDYLLYKYRARKERWTSKLTALENLTKE
ncbi:transcriptional regulator with XRE-family HTH domain [Bacillus sp. SORGH_AS 510]|uniref:helix-turn-helix domain-containing protein n=1 Tax=Bacillus sp. SORGH_AS_0510 TaxID=3041771 RepID=UPI002787B212|nr:helix-turn-helix transcriptional regulator [Bacillus sp. SORGH_AS_0510]MDQ1147044.1 transcriptional regulator with XRE-family HTH domain [Bacillus sp. SORGH_AS_0510]